MVTEREERINRWKKRMGMFASIDYETTKGLKSVEGNIRDVSDSGIVLIKATNRDVEVDVDKIKSSSIKPDRKANNNRGGG